MKAKAQNNVIIASIGFLLFSALIASILNTSNAFPAASEDLEGKKDNECVRNCWAKYDECCQWIGDGIKKLEICVKEKDACVQTKCCKSGESKKCNSVGTLS